MSRSDIAIERFLERWSRRKRLAARDVAGEDAAPPVGPAAAGAAVDPSCLPPIDAINAASDLRAFLAPGVPVELTRAALRKAWMADPAIRDFIEIAENQWDFASPNSVPGFGMLDLTPDLRRLIADLCGEPGDAGRGGDPERVAETPGAANSAAQAAALDGDNRAQSKSAVRKHGGALPR